MATPLYNALKKLTLEFDALAAGGGPVALAVTAPDNGILLELRMPGVPARIAHMAEGKAFTASYMGCATSALHERLHREGITLAYFMEPRMTAMAGGVPFRSASGELIAGIGISGRLASEDEELALKVIDFLKREMA